MRSAASTSCSGLALGELEEGIVDSYYGPKELREEAVGPTGDAATAGR